MAACPRHPMTPRDIPGIIQINSYLILPKKGIAAVAGDDYKSDMIGFENVLNDDEIRTVLAYIEFVRHAILALDQ